MTEFERDLAQKLARCTFAPATAEKRFVRDMASRAKYDPDAELSEWQRQWLFRLGHRFRRQLGSCWDPECEVAECQS